MHPPSTPQPTHSTYSSQARWTPPPLQPLSCHPPWFHLSIKWEINRVPNPKKYIIGTRSTLSLGLTSLEPLASLMGLWWLRCSYNAQQHLTGVVFMKFGQPKTLSTSKHTSQFSSDLVHHPGPSLITITEDHCQGQRDFVLWDKTWHQLMASKPPSASWNSHRSCIHDTEIPRFFTSLVIQDNMTGFHSDYPENRDTANNAKSKYTLICRENKRILDQRCIA